MSAMITYNAPALPPVRAFHLFAAAALAAPLPRHPPAVPVPPPLAYPAPRAALGLAPQHLPGIGDLGALAALGFGQVRPRAGSDHPRVRAFRLDQGAGHRRGLAQAHPRQFELALQIGDQAAELGAARDQLRDPDLAAEPWTGLIERDLVAARGGDGGHAGTR